MLLKFLSLLCLTFSGHISKHFELIITLKKNQGATATKELRGPFGGLSKSVLKLLVQRKIELLVRFHLHSPTMFVGFYGYSSGLCIRLSSRRNAF